MNRMQPPVDSTYSTSISSSSQNVKYWPWPSCSYPIGSILRSFLFRHWHRTNQVRMDLWKWVGASWTQVFHQIIVVDNSGMPGSPFSNRYATPNQSQFAGSMVGKMHFFLNPKDLTHDFGMKILQGSELIKIHILLLLAAIVRGNDRHKKG
jgi:hypothetical protein